MAKQYGLIVPSKERDKIFSRPSIFDEDSDSDDAAQKPTGLSTTLKKHDRLMQQKVVDEDPTVYQYDEIYDEMDKKRKESKLSRKDLDRKPKYINKLLAAADRRKKENERRIERQIQKERETEGDEFNDKDAFVTSSYKKKLEEMKEMEKQDEREEYLERIGDVKKQGNLDGFYRHLYDQKVNYNDEGKESQSISLEKVEEPKTSNANVKKRKYRSRQDSDSDKSEDEGKKEIKKEHLPSNLDADSDFSIDSSDSEDEQETQKDSPQCEEPAPKEEIEETNHTESQETSETTVAEEPVEAKKPKIDIWKKRTVGDVFDAALKRYYERKALAR